MHRLVMDLELEARGRCQERIRNLRQRKNRGEEGSSQSGTQRFQNRSCSQESHRHSRETRHHRDRSRSHGYDDRGSESPEERQPHNAAMDAMSRALRMAAQSPFSDEIERAPMPSRFTRPPFNSYNRKTDHVEHVSHYNHMMSLHAHNDALMYKVFPSSLGSTTLRWFNGLRKGSIRSFTELIQEFGSRFVTCSRVQPLVDALLPIKMRVGETLQSYANQYWELYNEIGGGNEKIAASTFRMGLLEDSELRESLTKRPPEDMRQLMRRIEEYKCLEDDRL